MKIKSNLQFNTSLLAQHTSKKDKVVIGGSLPEYVIIPAGATLELEDSKWELFKKSAESLLKGEHLTMVEAPKLSEEEQETKDEADLEAAQKEVVKLTKSKKGK